MTDWSFPEERRQEPSIPRELPREAPCHECGSTPPVINGLYYKLLRQNVGLTIVEEARVLGISRARLCRMENGEVPFPPHLAELCDKLIERRRKAGDW